MSSHLWSPSGSGNAAGVVEDIFQWFLSSKSVFSVPNQAKNRFSNILLLFLFLPLQGVRSTVTNRKFENVAGKGNTFWKISWNQFFSENSALLQFYFLLCDLELLISFLESLENVEHTLEAHARVCSLPRKKCGCDIPNYRFYIHMKSRYIFSTKLICFPYSRYLFLYGIDTLCMNPWPLYFTHV